MDIIKEKVNQLRQLMEKNGIDTYILTKNDPHQSEVCKEHWNCTKFISGFTGSNGNVVITKDTAALWTDGRYSIQAERELDGTGYLIYNTSVPGTKEFLPKAVELTPNGGVIGFDERTLSCTQAKALAADAAFNNITLKTNLDLAGEIWTDRPAPAPDKIFEHEIRYAGMDRKEKIALVRETMALMGGKYYVISSLDDIAWVFNLRCVEPDNTVFFESYSIITEDAAILFVDGSKIADVKEKLVNDGVTVKEYDEITACIKSILSKNDGEILYSPSRTSYALYNLLQNADVKTLSHDITTRLKAVKNSCEIENNKKIHIKDGVAVARFIKWIKAQAKNEQITEYEAGQYMDELRAGEETHLCPCFSTICGFGPNAASNHYHAEKDTALTIRPEGFLLVDSGGNYLDGTTDITRTIVLGEITQEMKENFTLVLKCHIALAKLKFLHGTTGTHIDIIARTPLWEQMKDFKHGTGHGIGFCLNCHEGPHRISPVLNDIVLEDGMFMSNEPGFYEKDGYGIRLENIIFAKKFGSSDYGDFLCFETISFCPFDLEAVEPALLDAGEKQWLNDYHQEVYDKLSLFMDDEEKQWLKEATKAI